MVAPCQLTEAATLDGVAVPTLKSLPANAPAVALRTDLYDHLTALEGRLDVGAVVLIGAGRGYSGDADIKQVIWTPKQPGLHEQRDRMDGPENPVICALHGTTMGGGLEMAIACRRRQMAKTIGKS